MVTAEPFFMLVLGLIRIVVGLIRIVVASPFLFLAELFETMGQWLGGFTKVADVTIMKHFLLSDYLVVGFGFSQRPHESLDEAATHGTYELHQQIERARVRETLEGK